MKAIPSILTLLLMGVFEILSAQNTPIDTFGQKEVFAETFPKTLSFRNDRLGVRDDYGYWEQAHLNFNSITKKYIQEEVDMPPIIAKWANTYAQRHPEKLMLIHLNGEGRSVNDPDMQKLYFPGHWVYEEGTVPLTDIAKNQITIALKDARPFSEKAYVVHGRNANGERLPHDVIIVALDDQGQRLWDTHEYATIEKVDYQNNSITIKRGQYNSSKRSFKKDRTYIAPIAGDFWGGNLMWYYNLSTTCPLDDKGQSAADVFVGEMKTWFGKNGVLEHIDGIGFDVNYFETDHDTWDCDNDGVADRGFTEGKNIWRIGDIAFLRKIRAAFGDDFIITADGWRDEMQRAVGILNGMETEGLCRWNDGYRQISRTINQHVYWNRHNTTKYQYSYITSKLRHPEDAKISTQLRRMGMALSSCLGVAYAYSAPRFIPEAVGGDLNTINWLGKPLEPMGYTFTNSKDLLNGSGVTFDADLLAAFELDQIDYHISENALHLKGTHEDVYQNTVVAGPEIDLPEGDLIVCFEAKAIQGFRDLGNDGLIPRKINVRLDGLPDFPAEPMNTQRLYNDLAGFMGTSDFTPQLFYFRNAGGSGKPLKIHFEAEEQGEFAIRNLKVYNAPCGIYRAFKNGMVLVNPSLVPITFDLNTMSDKEDRYRRLKVVPPIKGDLEGDLKEVMEYNNGERIKNNEVTVPGLNALFLIKS